MTDPITEEPGEDAEPEDRRKAPNDHRFPAEGDELPTADTTNESENADDQPSEKENPNG